MTIERQKVERQLRFTNFDECTLARLNEIADSEGVSYKDCYIRAQFDDYEDYPRFTMIVVEDEPDASYQARLEYEQRQALEEAEARRKLFLELKREFEGDNNA